MLPALAPSGRAQTHYVYQELGFLATGINNLGEVSGFRQSGHGYEAVTWSGGVTTLLGAGYAYGINNSGQVAGSAIVSDVYRAGYWQANGDFVDLGTGENHAGAARAISNGTNGQPLYVVGDFGELNEQGNYAFASRGFLYTAGGGTTILNSVGDYTTTAVSNNGTFTAIATQSHQVYGGVGFAAGGGWSLGQDFMPYGVNDAGVVVGGMVVGGILHGFSATFGGGVVDLGVGSFARAINASGTIVGFPYYAGTAFVVEDGQLYNLTDLIDDSGGFTSSPNDPKAINDLGQIVGFASNGSGFLLTPTSLVPEPASYATFCLLSVFSFSLHRRLRGKHPRS